MSIPRPVSKQPLPKKARKVFEGIIFDVYQWEQEMFDGSKQTFEKLVRDDTVSVVPVTQDGQIVVLEEEQPGKEPFIGIPGGRVEYGEDIEEATHRELLEESGYKSDSLTLWISEQPVTKIEWCIYTFIARDCVKVSDLHLDPGEKIKPRLVSFDEFLDLAIRDNFQSLEITLAVLKAKLDTQKLSGLKNLFLG